MSAQRTIIYGDRARQAVALDIKLELRSPLRIARVIVRGQFLAMKELAHVIDYNCIIGVQLYTSDFCISYVSRSTKI